jgi:hypothetical protein
MNDLNAQLNYLLFFIFYFSQYDKCINQTPLNELLHTLSNYVLCNL